MGLKYSKESIAFQRKKIYQIIKDKSLFKRVSKYRYYSELKHSKFLISPFGYGEINLKDFESFCMVVFYLNQIWIIWRLGQTFI